MRTIVFLSLVFFLSLASPVSAIPVLNGLGFDSGDWAIIGVPVHNYQALPVQRDLGTFITRDMGLMKKIQKDWDLESTFEDKCDYHYALKFYRNGELMRTVKLNLHCGYLTWDGMSYEFNPVRFEEFRTAARPIDWSRISFADLSLVKQAIHALDTDPNVYWYDDVYPYTYPGYFMLAVNNLPWNANLDSLDVAVKKNLVGEIASNNFYLKKYFHVVRNDKLYVRYMVNCESQIANRVSPQMRYLKWRSHLQEADSVRIVAIGINQGRYQKLMKKKSFTGRRD
jgi:hypothetical protein